MRRRRLFRFKKLTRQQQYWLKKLLEAAKEGFEKQKPQKRKRFSKRTKKSVLMCQNYLCRICGVYLEFPEFDHIDGDRSNNSFFNCQALCPNCHAKKTRRED